MSTAIPDLNSTESTNSTHITSLPTSAYGRGVLVLLLSLPAGIVLPIALMTATVVCCRELKERRRRKQYRPPLPEASSLDNIASVNVTSRNEYVDAELSVASSPFSYKVSTDQLRSAINSRRTHQCDGSNDVETDVSEDRGQTSFSSDCSHVTRDRRANNGSERELQNQQPPIAADAITASGRHERDVNDVEDENDNDYDYVEEAQWNSYQPCSTSSSSSLSKSGNTFARDLQQPTLLSPSNLNLMERQRQDILNRSRSNELLNSKCTNAGGYVVMTGVRGLGGRSAASSNSRLASSHTLHSHLTGSSHNIVSGDEVEYEGRVVPMNNHDDDGSDDGKPEVDYENVPSGKHDSKQTNDGNAVYYNSVTQLNDEDDDENNPQDCDDDIYYSTLRRGRIVTSELT